MHDSLMQKIMQEIGLDIDDNNHIIDQDTGVALQFKGKQLKYINNKKCRLERNEIPFDPVCDAKLMNNLFAYYINKINAEDGRYVNIYYSVQDKNSKKGSIILKEERDNITMQSNSYYNDSLKYMDLILQLNGNDNNLNAYDN